MENLTTDHKIDTQMDQVTITNGYWYYFNDQDVHISAHGSGCSGKETIYVDDKVVSDKRNLGLNSSHTFCHLGNDYEVRFKVISLMKANVECSLYRNGEHLATETKAFLDKDNKANQKLVLIFFIAGLLSGGLAAWLAVNFMA